MTGYYDLILGLIPLSLISITGVLTAVGFTFTSAVPIAASVPVVLIGHALFVRSPVEDIQSTGTQSTADATQSSADANSSFEPAD